MIPTSPINRLSDEKVEEASKSYLQNISGVDPDTAEALVDAGILTVTQLQLKSVDEIAGIDGIGHALAARIKSDVGGEDTGPTESISGIPVITSTGVIDSFEEEDDSFDGIIDRVQLSYTTPDDERTSIPLSAQYLEEDAEPTPSSRGIYPGLTSSVSSSIGKYLDADLPGEPATPETCPNCGKEFHEGDHVEGDEGEPYCSIKCLNEAYNS